MQKDTLWNDLLLFADGQVVARKWLILLWFFVQPDKGDYLHDSIDFVIERCWKYPILTDTCTKMIEYYWNIIDEAEV